MEDTNTLKMDSFKRVQGGSLNIGAKKYPLFKGINTIGRNKIATVNIKHLNISQNQAIMVLIDDTQHFLSDLNSSNGTFINNSKLIPFKLYELAHNTKISFGNVSAIYSKILDKNSTINVTSTLDTSEITQNMAQNFYASNTQLININDNSDHSHCNVNMTNSSFLDIHEEATQVVKNPLQLPSIQNLVNKGSTQLQECFVMEEGLDDIHDMPTQVVIMKSKLQEKQPKPNDNQNEVSQKSSNSDYNKDYHEASTQELSLPKNNEEKPKSDSSSTEILSLEETQNLLKKMNAKFYNEIESKDEHIVINGVQENKTDKIDTDTSTEEIDYKEETALKEIENMDEINKKTVKITSFGKKNLIHNSQTPSTSKDLGLSVTQYDESFIHVPNTNRSCFIEESVIENSNSNDSIDFLNKVQNNTNKNIDCNDEFVHKSVTKLPDTQLSIASNTSSGSDIIRQPIKPVPKLPETQLTLQSKPDTIDNSDSETDIDMSQEIGFIKRPPKQLLTQDSGSETEMDTQENHTKPTVNSDSETDCEDEILAKKSEQKLAINQIELDDSDCIPPTQDAFAEALGYQPVRSQNTNQSSEESFKLGLTELMIDDNKNDSQDSSKRDKKDDLLEVHKKDEDSVAKKFSFKKKSANLEESLTTILSGKKAEDKHDDVEDHDVFLLPTQTIDDIQKIEDDIFLQPTQIPKKSKNNTQSQKPDEDNDDIFLQPTQKLDYDIRSASVCNDDVFLRPTQVIGFKEGSSRVPNTQDDDLYAASTQILVGDINKRTEDNPICISQDDIYFQATQKNEIQTEDVYNVATQKVDVSSTKISNQTNACTDDPETDTQLEMPFISQTTEFKISDTSDRPVNPILRDIDKFLEPEKISEPSSLDKKTPSIALSEFKRPKTNRNDPNNVDEVETLSQIEAFINKPLAPPMSKSLKLSKDEKTDNLPETMSQIEAFVKKPVFVSLTKLSNLVMQKSAKEDVVEKHSSSKSFDSDEHFEKSNSSIELKSVVDQSFAVLESKIVKIRRKPKNDSDLNKINVTLTSHRRSMTLAENSTKHEPEIIIASRNKYNTVNTRSNNTKSKISNSDSEISTNVPIKPNTLISCSSEFENVINVTSFNKQANTSDSNNIDELTTCSVKMSTRGRKINTEKTKEESKIKSHARTKKEYKISERIIEKNDSSEPTNKSSSEGSSTTVLVNEDFKQSNGDTESDVSKFSKRLSKKKSPDLVEGSSSRKRTKRTEIVGESNHDLPEPPKRSSRKITKSSKESSINNEDKESNPSEKSDISTSTKISTNIDSLEDGKKVKQESSKFRKRISKRQLSNTSESDFVEIQQSSPAKRGRMIAKKVPSESTKSNTRESSLSSDVTITPRKGKRALTAESLQPTPERTKRKMKPKIVFTMLDSPQLESFIKHLGGSVVDSVDSCTVLVTKTIKRSQKLLTAVAQGKPICSPDWIHASKNNNDFLDPWDFLLLDEEAEKKWDFSLRESLIKASNGKLLNNYVFQIMVTNAVDVIKSAIENCGGKIVTRITDASHLNRFVIASPDQKSKFQKIKKQLPDVQIIDPEAIFDGVLRQDFRITRHLLI